MILLLPTRLRAIIVCVFDCLEKLLKKCKRPCKIYTRRLGSVQTIRFGNGNYYGFFVFAAILKINSLVPGVHRTRYVVLIEKQNCFHPALPVLRDYLNSRNRVHKNGVDFSFCRTNKRLKSRREQQQRFEFCTTRVYAQYVLNYGCFYFLFFAIRPRNVGWRAYITRTLKYVRERSAR